MEEKNKPKMEMNREPSLNLGRASRNEKNSFKKEGLLEGKEPRPRRRSLLEQGTDSKYQDTKKFCRAPAASGGRDTNHDSGKICGHNKRGLSFADWVIKRRTLGRGMTCALGRAKKAKRALDDNQKGEQVEQAQ